MLLVNDFVVCTYLACAAVWDTADVISQEFLSLSIFIFAQTTLDIICWLEEQPNCYVSFMRCHTGRTSLNTLKSHGNLRTNMEYGRWRCSGRPWHFLLQRNYRPMLYVKKRLQSLSASVLSMTAGAKSQECHRKERRSEILRRGRGRDFHTTRIQYTRNNTRVESSVDPQRLLHV